LTVALFILLLFVATTTTMAAAMATVSMLNDGDDGDGYGGCDRRSRNGDWRLKSESGRTRLRT